MYKITLIILFLLPLYVFSQEKKVSLEDIWVTYQFYPASIDEFYSMNDGENYTQLTGGAIEQYSFKTGKKVKEILNLNNIASGAAKPKAISSYEFSKDESLILIASDPEKIYRHSSKSDYWIYDIKAKAISKLSEGGKQQLAEISPDNKRVAFVRDNNLFIKELNSGKETQVTTDGKWAEIINGAPDWVYEEEFSFSKAFEWSPDGKYLAWLKFDERRVKEFNMTMYGSLYPEHYNYKYPKAGEDNSIVSLHVYNIESAKTSEIECGKENDQYIPRIKWTPTANVLSFIRMNRLQNHLELLFTDVTTGNVQKVIDEEDKCFIEITNNWQYSGNNIIWYSDRSGFYHFYLYDLNGNLINPITRGEYDVVSLDGYDEKTSTLYYTSAEVHPTERNVYAVKKDGSSKTQLTSGKGTNKIVFAKGYRYYINTFSSSDIPPQITLYNISGKQLRILEDNAELKKKIEEYQLLKREYFSFKTSDGTVLHGWMMKPRGFDGKKKYPVFMTVYGGPGAQETSNDWSYMDLWYQHIANNGYVIVCVDGRGTGYRGNDFRKATYGQLGKYEAIDQYETVQYLKSLAFVDFTRIGIYGWSFGGYLSSLCLFQFPETFKMAIAVAPVTNWRYYDSIYTERYNGLPKDNADGYDKNSPTNYVKKLKGKYMLIHGTADDNVHFQNSMELVTKLVEANKQFDTFFYPNSNHGIYTGRNTRYNLFAKMTQYIFDNL
jgi:dipeptidyl-peptidase-4